MRFSSLRQTHAPAAGAYLYGCGTDASVTANPAINGSTNISESVLMDSDKSVTANFVINPNTVYFQSVGTQTVGIQCTVTINITSSIYLTYAYFDLGFNSTTMQFDGILAVNWGNQFNPTTVQLRRHHPTRACARYLGQLRLGE